MIRVHEETKNRLPIPRTIAIGDIHGCAATLRELLIRVHPTSQDTVITLGDYIDRGPDSCGALDTLVELRTQCHLVPLLGNHEQMLFSARASQDMIRPWLRFGGGTTLSSYGIGGLPACPTATGRFLSRVG